MAEFTGERLIPGEVDVDLFNEHMARYAFAARYAEGKRVLDAGSGAGYGAAELARVATRVVGVDVAPEAVEFARHRYGSGTVSFETASCNALPFEDGSFDLVVGFEVIEHLEDWRGFLREAARVLAPGGRFLVSTPNKLYYTESRGEHGANPFHVHEFEFAEFREELAGVFPQVALFLENHVEGVSFQPHQTGGAAGVRVDAGDCDPDGSHFFVAVCARDPLPESAGFVYVPRAANVLRERERHIALLGSELAKKDEWLARLQNDIAEFDREHQKLLGMFREQKEELERSNRWAAQLNQEVRERGARIDALQLELAAEQEAANRMAAQYAAKVSALEEDIRAKTQWAKDVERNLTVEVDKQTSELVKAVEALHATEKELHERTEWALSLQEEGRRLGEQVALFRGSRWVKLGRKVGLGPVVPAG